MIIAAEPEGPQNKGHTVNQITDQSGDQLGQRKRFLLPMPFYVATEGDNDRSYHVWHIDN